MSGAAMSMQGEAWRQQVNQEFIALPRCLPRKRLGSENDRSDRSLCRIRGTVTLTDVQLHSTQTVWQRKQGEVGTRLNVRNTPGVLMGRRVTFEPDRYRFRRCPP